MTQMIVTLENNADRNFLRKMIENMKGVLKVSFPSSSINEKEDTERWIEKMNKLSNCIDSSIIDLDDEKTRYIMSK